MKVIATVYRSYQLEMEFDTEEVPEMIDPTGKAEWRSRSIPISDWELIDTAVDARTVKE